MQPNERPRRKLHLYYSAMMTTLETAHNEATELGADGLGEQMVAVTTTAMKLAILHLHIAYHLDTFEKVSAGRDYIEAFREIQKDVQKAVDQVLWGRKDRAAETAQTDPVGPEGESGEVDPALPTPTTETFDEYVTRTNAEGVEDR